MTEETTTTIYLKRVNANMGSFFRAYLPDILITIKIHEEDPPNYSHEVESEGYSLKDLQAHTDTSFAVPSTYLHLSAWRKLIPRIYKEITQFYFTNKD